ncbi:MAG TPA: type I DNA topoisomerase [Acidimicrobiia bacterium]|nr:type I DNA topoisomerase [Acidimicrobiia bacterium]
MAKTLVIVESPTKARTIEGFLERGVAVESSMGHVRDLPRNSAEIPEKLRSEPWSKLGVDVDHGFQPLYIVPKEKRDQIRRLKKAMEGIEELYLATDEDREGESIAWHLAEVLGPKVPVRRMVFHEITPRAIQEAFANPREIDQRLVDAQETRRVLDRLVGYEVSPVLWRMIQPRLSAGRVQSVAVRLVVQREWERIRFRSAGYWDVLGTFLHDQSVAFPATLVEVEGRRLATGRDFDSFGELSSADVLVLDEATARSIAAASADADISVRSVERKPYRRSPYPPFRTSTLQQEAGRKLGFSAARTMSAAQRLYERGYITYMRTDSTALSESAVAAARSEIAQRFGTDFVPSKPRSYQGKVRNAQEAHEAIRPAGERFRHPDEVAGSVGSDDASLYQLIWRRTIASQMTDATGVSVAVRLGGIADRQDVVFATSGRVLDHQGFLRVYVEGSDDPEADLDDQERRLPPLREGDRVEPVDIEAKGHETKPPARFTEASLVRRLEELGVGRPSTYASILTTIQDRGYAWKKGSALVPTWIAFAAVSLLEAHFPTLVDYEFTARMEDELDRIAAGDEESLPWLSHFYFGEQGLRETVEASYDAIDARKVNSIEVGVTDDGVTVSVRVGRYGPFLERGEDRASLPEDLAPDELTMAKAIELLDAPSGDKILGTDPDSGLTVLGRAGRYGPYVQLGSAEEVEGKPKTVSLFSGMELDEIGLDTALRLLSLPRLVGIDPDGREILALSGRYGPFLKRDDETRNLDEEGQIFEVSLDEALARFAEPPRRRGQRRTATALRTLGESPETGKQVEVRDGRFGPYVTDGEVNASLRKGDQVESISFDRANELLAERRAKLADAPPKKRRAKKP